MILIYSHCRFYSSTLGAMMYSISTMLGSETTGSLVLWFLGKNRSLSPVLGFYSLQSVLLLFITTIVSIVGVGSRCLLFQLQSSVLAVVVVLHVMSTSRLQSYNLFLGCCSPVVGRYHLQLVVVLQYLLLVCRYLVILQYLILICSSPVVSTSRLQQSFEVILHFPHLHRLGSSTIKILILIPEIFPLLA